MTENTTAETIETNAYEEYLASPLLSAGYGPPPAGVIRPGIMVLKKGCTAQDEKVYADGISKGCTWDEIDKNLGLDADKKSKLIPRNVDYFTVRENDAINSAWIKAIKERYADSDGVIRKLPVWFSSNEWWNIIPHSLKCWSAGGIRYCSAFKTIKNNDGHPDRKRVCEYFVDGPERKRLFGGRDKRERPCDPDSCPEYQRKECKFSGSIHFYIPGIPGGPWLIPTTSWYSINAIYAALKEMRKLTHGKVAKLWLNNQAVFQLRKVLDTVSHVNGGQAEKKDQYLIYLEPVVDLMELAAMFEDKQVIARGNAAAAVLSQPAVEPVPEEQETTGEETLSEEQTEQQGGATKGREVPAGKDPEPDAGGTEQWPPAGSSFSNPPKNEGGQNGNGVLPDQRKAIKNLASRYGITEQRVDEVMKGVSTHKEAGDIIKELSKGDTSRFLPKQPAHEERY